MLTPLRVPVEDSVLSVAPITIATGSVALVAYGAGATEER